MLRKGVVWMAMAGMLLTGFYQWFFSMSRTAISETPQQTVVSIASGATLGSIARQLNELGLVDYPVVFNTLMRLSKMEHKLRAGDYKVDTTWTYQELMTHLVNDPEVQYPIRLIEGMTLAEAMTVVQGNEKVKRDFADADTQALSTLLAIPNNAEGMLLPDTYFIHANTSETTFYKRANAALTEMLVREWPKRVEGLPFNSAYEAVVAASVVEKETGIPSERPMIAAAIVQRLKKGIPLQMDPTVIYGLGSRFDGNIHKKDLSDPSPYNTYMHKGLPPTPIALASAESIYAILHPANSEAIYFVAKGDGSHQFSVTLEDHNAAVRKYQLGK